MAKLREEFTPETSPANLGASASPDVVLWSRHELKQVLRVGDTAIYEWMRLSNDPLPSPIQLGPTRSTGRPGRVFWLASEVLAWIARRAAQPRAGRVQVPDNKVIAAQSQPA